MYIKGHILGLSLRSLIPISPPTANFQQLPYSLVTQLIIEVIHCRWINRVLFTQEGEPFDTEHVVDVIKTEAMVCQASLFHTHTHTHTYTHTHSHSHSHARTHTLTNFHTHTHTHKLSHTHTHTHSYTYAHTHIITRTLSHSLYTFTHSHTLSHTHIYML